MGFSSFLRRRNSSFAKPLLQSLLLKTRPFLSSSSHGCGCWCDGSSSSSRCRSFSSSPSPLLQQETPPATFPDPKSSLSARMSFVFDQIDAIERERAGKDDTLQRIRAWREKKQQQQKTDAGPQDAALGSAPEVVGKKENLFSTKRDVELVHPWPEWIELMERLAGQNYFDHRRKDEDRMIQDALQVDGITSQRFVEEGFDFTRDLATVRNACLNFGRDRFDILRSLSRKDIQILVGHGCPSTDVKLVFSAKLLRKHAHIDEGDVCSSCNLRNTCSRAYLLSRKEDEARTLDVMRVLLMFGFDPVIGSVENKALLNQKSVKTVVRKLLHEVVKLSAVPIDPNLPPPVIKRPPPKVKQPPPPPKKRVGRDDIEMKKGDWLCPKCDFMNFAKNTACLQCDAKRPKRQLLPGEWECPECNFLNYRRNVVCFHCEHKRPPDEFVENQVQEKTRGARTRLETAARIPGVSDAWNFDFDDNESDGADVAAFEFADSPRMAEVAPSNAAAYRGSLRDSEDDDSLEDNPMSKARERGRYSDPSNQTTPLPDRTGFDDFDDEEDDNIDNYELDMPNKNSKRDLSVKSFSEEEDSFDSHDLDDSDLCTNSRRRHVLHSHNNPSQQRHGRAFPSGSADDNYDDNLEQNLDSDTEEWKSSHVADSGLRRGGRSGNGPYRGLSFGSEDELGSYSDSDNDRDLGPSPRGKWSKQASKGKGFGRGRSNPESDELLFSSESDDDDRPSQRREMRGQKHGIDRSRNNFNGDNRPGRKRDTEFRSNKMIDGRHNSFRNSDHDRSFRSFRKNDRGPLRDDYDERRGSGREHHDKSFQSFRKNDRGRGSGRESHDRSFQSFRKNDRGHRRDDYDERGGNVRERQFRKSNRQAQDGGFGHRQSGRYNGFGERGDSGRGFEDDRPRRRIIER